MSTSKFWIALFFLSLFVMPPTSAGPSVNDLVLEKLKTQLPPAWTISLSETELVIESSEACWVKMENKINAPVFRMDPKKAKEDILKSGQKIKARITFKIENRWTPEKLQEAKNHNDAVGKNIRDLAAKCGVASLFNPALSRKGGEFFSPETPEDSEKLKRYQAEKEKLEAQTIRLPEYTTEKFSLFLLRKEGFSDEFHTIFPEEISEQGYSILYNLEKLSTNAP